jgi:hypothetical protein
LTICSIIPGRGGRTSGSSRAAIAGYAGSTDSEDEKDLRRAAVSAIFARSSAKHLRNPVPVHPALDNDHMRSVGESNLERRCGPDTSKGRSTSWGSTARDDPAVVSQHTGVIRQVILDIPIAPFPKTAQ